MESLNDEQLRKSNQLGGGLVRPDRDLLSLMSTRDRLIKAKRYSEIESIEKQIAALEAKLAVKQHQKKQQDHLIAITRFKIKQDEQRNTFRANKQLELEVMLTRREKDFVIDNQKLLNQRRNLEDVFAKQIKW